MKTETLLGDEAVALAAIHAGIGGAFSYPGTPATEILEYIMAYKSRLNGQATFHADWSANEKVAYEEALGMSFAGKRAIVSMKHVGLNVAADPFMNSALTGANGGLVVVVADDPGMHSSQNEQDTREFAAFAQIPVFEPSNQQEAYYMTLEAFEESERLQIPVLIRMVTRLAHSRANVTVLEKGKETTPRPELGKMTEWTLLPMNARVQNLRLIDKNAEATKASDDSGHNPLKLAGSKGIICCGITANYVYENIGDDSDYSVLKITRYPLPPAKVRKLVEHCDDILVVEDSYPYVEKQLNGIIPIPGKTIRGRLTGDLPRTGELTPDILRETLKIEGKCTQPETLPGRPPQLCKGCPHIDTYNALVEAMKSYETSVCFSDIGCYTLGYFPPYNAIQSCVDMGASIGMARGAALAGHHPSICAIGDSTFTHSGMTCLIGAARSDTNMTVIILDNAIIGMTGGQETMATGDTMIQVLNGLGVSPEAIHTINPLPKHHAENVETFCKAIEHKGLSVIVAQRPCIQIKK